MYATLQIILYRRTCRNFNLNGRGISEIYCVLLCAGKHSFQKITIKVSSERLSHVTCRDFRCHNFVVSSNFKKSFCCSIFYVHKTLKEKREKIVDLFQADKAYSFQRGIKMNTTIKVVPVEVWKFLMAFNCIYVSVNLRNKIEHWMEIKFDWD